MRLAALVTVLGWFGLGLQFQAVSAQVSPAAGAPGFLSTIAGVYRFHFKNGFVRPEDGTYESEDILEVVPLDERTAYVRAALEFFNGHSGGIYGVATLQGRTLLYDDDAPAPIAVSFALCGKTRTWSRERTTT